MASVSQISEEQLLYDPVYDLAISNHRSKSVLKCISWLNFPFLRVNIGVFRRKSEELSNGTNVAFNLDNDFSCAHL
jgi:hypothetical protein